MRTRPGGQRAEVKMSIYKVIIFLIHIISMINYTDQVLIKFKRSQYRYLKDKADKYRMPISALIRDILIKYNL